MILLLVYYRMFDENGPLRVNAPIYTNNSYIGRVDANDIPPPHNVSSLAGRICYMEGRVFSLDENGWKGYVTEVFKTISSPEALNLGERLSLLSADRPGSRPQEPVVVKSVKCPSIP